MLAGMHYTVLLFFVNRQLELNSSTLCTETLRLSAVYYLAPLLLLALFSYTSLNLNVISKPT